MPLWVFHGAKDRVIPVWFSQKMVKAIEKAGGKPKYTEYPKVGHDSWNKAYETPELWEWLFAQELAP